MADVPSWQLTIQPSDHLLHPDRVATNLYGCSLRILTGLVDTGEEHLEPTLLEGLFYQEQRLKLWGNNFDAREGGLDERLVGLDDMKEILLPLLLRLADILTDIGRLVDICPGLEGIYLQIEDLRTQVSDETDNAENEEDTAHSTSGDLHSAGSRDRSDSSGSDISSDDDSYKLEQSMEDLGRHIVLLYRLGPALYEPADKAPGPFDRARGDSVSDQSTKNFLNNTAGPRILRIIDTFPSIDKTLARRLGEANEVRYNRLREARDKAAMLAYESDNESSDEEASEVMGQQPSMLSHVPTRQTQSEYTAPSTELSSIFEKPQAPAHTQKKATPRIAASVTSFASSLMSESTPNHMRGIPKIPNNNGSLEGFDCTICGSRLSTVANTAAWVRHVYQDLQPYICTFNDCHYGLKTFMSRREWAEHEFSKHRQMTRWKCDICSLDISTELSCKVHISETHMNLDITDFESLQKSASDHSAAWMYRQSCPFCGTSPANSKRGFISHVARHLQEVSHAAIPPSAMQGDLTEFGDDTDDEALSEGADEGSDRVDRTLTAFSKKQADSDELKQAIHQWLEAPGISINHEEAVDKRFPGTCQWFLKNEAFIAWRDGSPSTLWICDGPGVGKTVLCSAIITALQEMPRKTTLYYYVDYKIPEKTRVDGFLRSMIQQLLSNSDRVYTYLQELYQEQREEKQSPSGPQLREVLSTLGSLYLQPIYLVIDAVDELLVEDLPVLLQVFQDMMKSFKDMNLLLTSRRSLFLEENLSILEPRMVQVLRQEQSSDIENYINARLNTDKRMKKWPLELKEQMLEALTLGADGMFMWVRLQLDELRSCRNPLAVRKTLNKSPMAMDQTYERILRKIPSEDIQNVSKVLQWLCFSTRPMRLTELNEVVAVQLNDDDGPNFDADLRYLEPRDLLEACGSMIMTTEPSDSNSPVEVQAQAVELTHFSAREFLLSDVLREGPLRSFHVTEPSANAFIAVTCLGYLLYASSRSPNPIEDINKLQDDYPLLRYALKEWQHHYGKSIGHSDQKKLDNLAYKLIVERKLPQTVFLVTGGFDLNMPAIYYASIVGATGVVSRLLEEGVDPDDLPKKFDRSALGAACYAGHEDVVQLLLDKGASMKPEAPYGMMPLHFAARGGRRRIIQLLLNQGGHSYVHWADNDGNTPLHCAARTGDEEIVQMLLDAGTDIQDTNSEDLTPLDVALNEGMEKVVQLLVDHGFDVNAFYGSYGTRLVKAARTGDERAVKILLSVGADPNLLRQPKPWPHPHEPGTPLQEAIACRDGEENIVKMLLEAGADPNRASWSGSAIHWAAGAGNERILRLLLDAGADVHSVRSENECALNVAVTSGQEGIVRQLLEAGADPNHGDSGPGGTPLKRAIRRKFGRIESMLREAGAVEETSDTNEAVKAI